MVGSIIIYQKMDNVVDNLLPLPHSAKLKQPYNSFIP